MQLGKLQEHLGDLKAEGTEVLAISIDKPEQARRMAVELGLPFPRRGKICARKIDRKFGENAQEIIGVLKKLKAEA